MHGLPCETSPGNAGIFRRTTNPVNWTQLTSSNKRLVTITLSSVFASMAVIVARHIETVHDMYFFKERETEPFYSWFISDGSKKLKPITFSNSKWMSPNFDSPWDYGLGCCGQILLQWARSIQPTFRPVRPGKEDLLKRWTCFFETFPVGPNRSIEFWTEISENFG